jgi:hypothetical protein
MMCALLQKVGGLSTTALHASASSGAPAYAWALAVLCTARRSRPLTLQQLHSHVRLPDPLAADTHKAGLRELQSRTRALRSTCC